MARVLPDLQAEVTRIGVDFTEAITKCLLEARRPLDSDVQFADHDMVPRLNSAAGAPSGIILLLDHGRTCSRYRRRQRAPDLLDTLSEHSADSQFSPINFLHHGKGVGRFLLDLMEARGSQVTAGRPHVVKAEIVSLDTRQQPSSKPSATGACVFSGTWNDS